MTEHKVGSREQWLAARIELLAQEKELTRRSDELARRRRELPWVAVEEQYVFQAHDGPKSLSELFAGRSQLLVFHLMFGPDDEAACSGCSFTADSLAGGIVHLEQHGVTFVAVSRAPLEKLQDYRRLMGWEFPWVSAFGTDFNLDFSVFTEEERRTGAGFNFGAPRRTDLNVRETELHGLSAFALDEGVVYHTYSCYDRGTDALTGTWQLLDRAPMGRDGAPKDWPRRHYEYEDQAGGRVRSPRV
jgi:predicted dithiol-disulfide oxidoreductase (DUF899 family)